MTIGELMQEMKSKNVDRVLVRVNGKHVNDYKEEDTVEREDNPNEPAECVQCPMRHSRRCGNCPVC